MEMRSNLPGRVIEVKVSPGQSVRAGDPVITLEVMKMTQEIVADAEGTVASIAVAAGEELQPGQLILTLA